MNKLVQHLISIGVLKTPRLIEGFKAVDRADFVSENMRDLAYVDEALPIGFGQTISQPYTVAFMLELLQPMFGDNIFEIGYGSGWQATILAEIVSQNNLNSNFKIKNEKLQSKINNHNKKGKVYAAELIQELCELGKNNISKYNFIEKGIVETFCQDASRGLPDIAKQIGGFDKIIAAASLPIGYPIANLLPQAWKNQLKIGGRIVVPIGHSIWLFIKKSAAVFESREYPGFAFVPFV